MGENLKVHSTYEQKKICAEVSQHPTLCVYTYILHIENYFLLEDCAGNAMFSMLMR